MKIKIIVSTLAAVAATVSAPTVFGADPLEPYPVKGKVLQRLNSFDNPEGSIFSADGKFVFISNSAELGMPDVGFNWTHKAGYLSKLAVQPDGTLKDGQREADYWSDGAPGYGSHPCCHQEVSQRHHLPDRGLGAAGRARHPGQDPKTLDPKIIAFNNDGKILGTIKMGEGSAAAKAAGVPATLGNALAFDKEGNLYAIDTEYCRSTFDPPIDTRVVAPHVPGLSAGRAR